ncbi:MAG: hypothetical protein GWP09_03200 [Nitrospiraceae bacterium]|nr:hypothetical protein [Nitrospiraceae bacterium]
MKLEDITEIYEDTNDVKKIGFKIEYERKEEQKVRNLLTKLEEFDDELGLLRHYTDDIFSTDSYVTLFSYRIYFGKENKDKKYISFVAHGPDSCFDPLIYQKNLKNIKDYVTKKWDKL